MTAARILTDLMTTIDARRWDDLAAFLHDDFTCHYVHTGETFDRAAWIRLNAEYPGFDRLTVEEVLGDAERAACRSHVTGHGKSGLDHFACATFVRVHDGRIIDMTEVWTDMAQTAPDATRPGDAA